MMPRFARCRLMLQSFAQFRLRSCNSLNSRTFSMAMTACQQRSMSSAICFSVNGRTSIRPNRLSESDSLALSVAQASICSSAASVLALGLGNSSLIK